MARGRVKWFDEKKGYGFFLMEGQKDIFVHRSAIKGELLKEGDEVEFEIAQGHKDPEAVNVKVVG